MDKSVAHCPACASYLHLVGKQCPQYPQWLVMGDKYVSHCLACAFLFSQVRQTVISMAKDGRHSHVNRNERYCGLCNDNEIGD